MESADPLRVVVVEDDPTYRDNLRTVLSLTPGFDVQAAFGSAEAALAGGAVESGGRRAVDGWDLALMDIQMPGVGGVEGTRRLKALCGDVQVVMLTTFEAPEVIVDAIRAGADGYVLKKTPLPDFLALLRQVRRGASPLSPEVAHAVLQAVRGAPTSSSRSVGPPPPSLSARETEVLEALVDGDSYKEVAAKLGVSVDTVRSYIRTLYRKLQVNSAAGAVSRALREGLVAR